LYPIRWLLAGGKLYLLGCASSEAQVIACGVWWMLQELTPETDI